MFYVGHLNTTTLLFPHFYLKDLSSPEFVLNHLKLSIQGSCFEQHGYFIQVLPIKGLEQRKGIRVSAIQVKQEGLYANIQFDCLCFKIQKGDIVDIIVESINPEMIRGKLGSAEFIIPRKRMLGLTYSEDLNIYVVEDEYGQILNVCNGFLLRCRCLQWAIQKDAFMKVMAETDSELVSSKFKYKF